MTGKDPTAGRRINSGVCENCRFETVVGDLPSFSGDRIYVMKLGLSLPFFTNESTATLKRWDVAVFKLPEEPEVRYIKRLVGMPNEVVRIQGGDLWGKSLDNPAGFQRLRRTLNHQQAMQLMVYDDSHRAALLQRRSALAAMVGRLERAHATERSRRPDNQPTGPSCATITWSPTRDSGKRFGRERHRASPARP